MDDERKKPHRKGGRNLLPPGAVAIARDLRERRGFAGKPRAEGGKKPFRARREDAGEANAERPQRDFKRDDRPRETAATRGRGALSAPNGPVTGPIRARWRTPATFGKGGICRKTTRRGRQEAVSTTPRRRRGESGASSADFKRDDRPRDGGDKRPGRFERTGDAAPSGRGRQAVSGAEGGKKPFQPRRDDAGEARAERPQRDFKRDDRPRDSGNSRPGRFERSERTGDGAPSGRGERPFRAGAEGKPYGKRPQRDGEAVHRRTSF